MTTFYTLMDSPVNELLLTSDGESLTRLHFSANGEEHRIANTWVRDDSVRPLSAAREQLAAYFAGDLDQFHLPLAPSGTEFQQGVWRELIKIPYGQTISYGDLAKRIGNANASRAVGLANGRNPIGIVIPCHRVIGADGTLTGFGGGLANKQRLLELERLHVGATNPAQQQSFAWSG